MPKVDYSGANKTAGWYIVRTGKSVSFNGGSIPAHNMFKVLSISGDTATVEYNGSTGTVNLSQTTVLQVTATGGSSSSSGVKFGLTDKGVTVNEDGSWSVEMYLEGADSSFKYDAWYGIYDLGVTPTSREDSQGAWGYVVPEPDDVMSAALEDGDKIPSKRFTFTYTSDDLDTPISGKGNPKLGGTYNVFLFGTDRGDNQYTIRRSFPITIPAKPTVNADYEHVIIIGVDGAGTFFNNASTPNMDRIFQNGAYSNTVRTEDPSMSAQNWASMLHGVADDYHNISNDFAYANEYPTNSAYPSVFKVIRDNYPNAKLGSFTNWRAINSGIIENGIGVDKTQGISDARITEEVVKYVNANSPQLVFIQFDEADQVGHNKGFGSSEQKSKITELDGYIGQIYDAYKNKGLLDKTLFIVTTDHGGTTTGNHGGMSNEEINVSFFATGKTVKSGEFNGMMVRDTAAVVLHALGCVAPTTYQAEVPNNLFEGVSRSTDFDFGVSAVRVNGSSYEIDMYIEGADNRFGHDAWFGIYDGNVTAEALYENGGAISQGAWDYVAQGSGKHTTSLSAGTRLGSGRRTFAFKSSDLATDSPNANPVVGGTYTIFLFYTDGHDGYGYVVADSVGVTIKADDGVNFGLTENGVTVRPDGSWAMEMYLEGTDSSYEYDTWYGVYDADVSTADILAGGGSLSQGTWGYVKAQNNQDALGSDRYVFSFDSGDCDKSKNNPVPGKTYNVYLFKCDRGGANSKQYTVAASFPLHIPGNANTGDGYLQFGFTNTSDKIVVNADGSWSIKMFISGADSRFDSDAWVGIYDADVTKEELLAYGGDMSQGAWMSIGEFSSAKKEFVFHSSMMKSDSPNPNPTIGGRYNIVLFYADTAPNGYVVARMIPFTLPTVSTNVDFGLTETGVTVNADGSWEIEMYLEGADGRFQHDTWFGIYDATMTDADIKAGRGGISQGAWGYVVPNGDKIHETKLSSGTTIGSDKIVFSFKSGQMGDPVAGKLNPAIGGTYRVCLFFTDQGDEQYTVADSITFTLDADTSSNLGGENNGETGGETGDTHKHAYNDMVFDEEFHWNECDCGATDKKKLHTMKDGVCTICGYELDENVQDDEEQTVIDDAVDEENKDTSTSNNSDKGTNIKNSGCKSAIAASTVVLATVIVLGAGLKKKED